LDAGLSEGLLCALTEHSGTMFWRDELGWLDSAIPLAWRTLALVVPNRFCVTGKFAIARRMAIHALPFHRARSQLWVLCNH